jgi:hypothetical protein
MSRPPKKLECPHCHQRAISFWRKQFFEPGSTATCQSCGGKMTVPWWARFTNTPVYVAVIIAVSVEGVALSSVSFWLTFFVSFAISVWLTHRYVPLIPRQSPDAAQGRSDKMSRPPKDPAA